MFFVRPTKGYFDVTRYGALGNGVHIDTTAIQSAIDAAEAYSVDNDTAATVLMPPGKYRVDGPLVVTEHTVHILGAGGYSDLWAGFGTSIVPTEDFPDGDYVLAFDWDGKALSLGGNTLRNISIAVEQSETLTNTVHGLYWGVCKGYIENVYIDNVTGRGVGIEGHSSDFKVYENTFFRLQTRRTGSHGLEHIASASDNWFLGCMFQAAETAAGIYNIGAGNFFNACHFTGNKHHLQNTTGSSECFFTGCQFETAKEHSIFLDCTSGGVNAIRFNGCNFNGNSFDAANTSDNINISRTAGGNTCSGTISGCTFRSNSGLGNSPRYHINIADGSGFSFHVGDDNVFSGAGTGNYNVHANATRCLINGMGNNGANDPTSAGEWNGQGVEGVTVVKTDTNTLYRYANGEWRLLN